MTAVPRIAITPGEPAGIGPDLALCIAQRDWPAELVFVADRDLINERADQLDIAVDIRAFAPDRAVTASTAGRMNVLHVARAVPTQPGMLDPANGPYVLTTLDTACDGCLAGSFAAMVTGPVQKSVIAAAGTPFTGHTEYLAARTGAPLPVMLLCAGDLRVALVTTHLPLRDVPAAIVAERIAAMLNILDAGLRDHFGIAEPRISVLGLNPHAGESGRLGDEEERQIRPAIEAARARGLRIEGPLPADTAFTPPKLAATDAVLAMYHDQGLPVLKHHGFGRAVNVTLGLPIVRTSVDHGTALELAGTGRADPGSFVAAVGMAIDFATR